MEIIKIDINKIKEYENNAKDHPEWQIAQISKSIQEFGFNDPITINGDFQIIEGHGRYLACKKLGIEEIPCIVLKNLTEAQERAYIIAHNKLTINTGFDRDKLMYELNSLKIEGIDIEAFGFTAKDLEVAEIEALDAITNESFTSLADEIKNESSIFTISFNFPVDKREKIEEFIKLKTKEYFVNKILEEMEGE